MKQGTFYAGLTTAAILTGGLGYLVWQQPPTAVIGGNAPLSAPHVIGLGSDAPTAASAPDRPLLSPVFEEKKGKRYLFDVYANDPRPEAKYKAYTMAYECQLAMTMPTAFGKQEGHFCGVGDDRLRPGQLAQDKRLPLVIDAARAGVPDAWAKLHFWEYPNGPFGTVWPDKATFDQVDAETLKTAIDHADPTAILTQFAPGAPELSPSEGLKRWVMFRTADYLDNDRGDYDPNSDQTPTFQKYAARLTPEQRQQAINEGIALVRQLRRKP